MIKKYLAKQLCKRIIKDISFMSDYCGCVKYIRGKDILHNKTLYNYKCHINSVDKYKEYNKFQVKVCLQVDGDD